MPEILKKKLWFSVRGNQFTSYVVIDQVYKNTSSIRDTVQPVDKMMMGQIFRSLRPLEDIIKVLH